jgi:hypothetical protein
MDPLMMQNLLTQAVSAALVPFEQRINARFDGIDARFDALDHRINGIDLRLSAWRKILVDNLHYKATRRKIDQISSSVFLIWRENFL